MTDTEVRRVAAGLTKYHIAFLRAASTKPKQWMTIRRHAKIPASVRVHGIYRIGPQALVEDVGSSWRHFVRLTPFGLAVRNIIKEQDNGQ